MAEIEKLDESVVGVGELAFVDDEAGVKLARDDGGDDFVEGNDRGFDLWPKKFKGEVSSGKGAGDGDAGLLDLRQG